MICSTHKIVTSAFRKVKQITVADDVEVYIIHNTLSFQILIFFPLKLVCCEAGLWLACRTQSQIAFGRK